MQEVEQKRQIILVKEELDPGVGTSMLKAPVETCFSTVAPEEGLGKGSTWLPAAGVFSVSITSEKKKRIFFM